MSQSRQLAAIMFTDIVGYTTLMGNDEEEAFAVLAKNRELQKPIIEHYNGRWLKELGDGVMVSFNTVSDAVNAAIRIQKTSNATKEFKLRIGIHQGEVVFENDDVFGDGVNIASRIQAIAYPGSIYISESVRDNISNKKDFQTKFIAEVKLKNVKSPVKIYQMIAEGIETAPTVSLREKMKAKKIALPILAIAIVLFIAGYFIKNILTSKSNSEKFNTKEIEEKSIAVLPFVDMSETKDQEYLGDGLAEEIINSITAIKSLKVIGRTSSFQYKGKGLDAKTIGEKLNVSSVMEGSIQKSGNNIRITTNLIRVKDNSTIWSQQFDKELKDIFAIQDSIANNIVQTLKIILTESEKPRLIKKETDPEVYSLYLKGLFQYKKEEFEKSIEYNLRAISIDSLFAPSYAYLALARIRVIYRSGAFSDFNAIREAKEFANKAIVLDPDLAESYSALALLAWTIELDFASANLNFEKSIQLNPSASLIKNRYAYFLLWMGDFDKAEKLGLDAISSDPADYNGYLIVSSANIYKKKFGEAEKYIAEGRQLFPELFAFENQYIQSNFFSGNYKQVIYSVKDLLLKNPDKVSENLLAFLSISYLKSGNLTESKNIFRQLKEKSTNQFSNIDYNLARIYLQYRKKDSCYLSLEKSFANREPEFKLLKTDPLFDNIKKDQQFKELYHRYGFDRYQ